jgi:hypothetical protein
MDDKAGGCMALVVLGLIFAAGLYLLGFNFGMTSEGTVDYSGCESVIHIKGDDIWQRYFHKFICNAYTNQNGIIIGGECARIEKDNSYPTPLCARAYVYELPQATNPLSEGLRDIAWIVVGIIFAVGLFRFATRVLDRLATTPPPALSDDSLRPNMNMTPARRPVSLSRRAAATEEERALLHWYEFATGKESAVDEDDAKLFCSHIARKRYCVCTRENIG